jgi:uncharacterized protein YjeT (DUF2065 family)
MHTDFVCSRLLEMARNTLSARKVLGIALMVIGVGLLWWGYQLSGSIGSELTETITGSLPNEVMARYIAGGASVAVGLHLLFRQ